MCDVLGGRAFPLGKLGYVDLEYPHNATDDNISEKLAPTPPMRTWAPITVALSGMYRILSCHTLAVARADTFATHPSNTTLLSSQLSLEPPVTARNVANLPFLRLDFTVWRPRELFFVYLCVSFLVYFMLVWGCSFFLYRPFGS